MPYKYIGRTTNFKGNTLWEIVGNLKNFGVGRVVVRSVFEKYPAKSYCKILKVEPLPCPEVQNMDNFRKVRVTVEKTFRGLTLPKPVTIESVSYKPDYRLLTKEEEEFYCKNDPIEVPVMPRTMELPPLLKEVVLRENKAKGEDVGKDLDIEIVYKKENIARGNFRIAKDGEKPSVAFEVNVQKLPDISLYRNIKVSI